MIKVSQNLSRPVHITDMYGDNSDARKLLKWDYDMDFYKSQVILIGEEIKSND